MVSSRKTLRNFIRQKGYSMLARLRFIKGLVKDCQFLREQLRQAKLSPEEKSVIKHALEENEQLIASLIEEVQPVIDKFNDPNLQIFVENYYFRAKRIVELWDCMSTSESADNVRRCFERSIKKFWKL